ncbi:MAG: serine protease, partial [Clostridia bacterium]|nr:serine protease [Clostridia bacterium]
SKGIIKAVFTVDVYNQVDKNAEKCAQGSGVVFFRQEDFGSRFAYYLLTNNHVISNGKSYAVRDCYGKEYSATLVESDANYDLAILKFTATEVYTILNFVKSDVSIGDSVIAVGAPNGQINAVTLGSVVRYTFVTVDGHGSDSNVNFKVIEHDAPIYSGSSGGVLLNYSYEICGINYATSATEDGEFISAYAVSASKVLEFING